MNYDRYAQDPINSPLFNGNASSMGGNGEYDPNYIGVRQNGRTPNLIASGGGGGCVKSGPFSELVFRFCFHHFSFLPPWPLLFRLVSIFIS